MHGFGPTFNIDERVQAFTHPLWFLQLALVSALSTNVFFAVFFSSLIYSLLTAWILVGRLSISVWHAFLISSVLILSKAYVDFSTSGLENTLSHLLVVLFFSASYQLSERYSRLKHTVIITICSLIYLNRPDLVLIVLPLLSYQCWLYRKQKGDIFKALLIGVLPAILWELFSLFYYGFPFPNTAYAKLNTGIPHTELFNQGFQYFLNSIDNDPLTLSFILLSLLISWRASSQVKMICLGILSYLFYVLFIGGDFMSGRFFTTPLIATCVIMARLELPKQQIQILTILCLGLGCISIKSTLLSNSSYTSRHLEKINGIADERGIYYPDWGLLIARQHTYQYFDWKKSVPTNSLACGLLGFSGLARGPSHHIIDTCALADPLLSKLPAFYDPGWRIGHFERTLPEGYAESIRQNHNLIIDPQIKRYYDAIRLITRGPLFSKERVLAIIKINSGKIPQPLSSQYSQVTSRYHTNYALIALQH